MNRTRRFVGVRSEIEDLGERIAPSAVNPAELFIDRQLVSDIAITITDFKTLTTDVNGSTATPEQIALDELKVSRDLMITQLDQQFDVQLDTPVVAPTTPSTEPVTTPTTP